MLLLDDGRNKEDVKKIVSFNEFQIFEIIYDFFPYLINGH